jgi:tRNA A37 methylthiotransferase MiaB
MERVNMSLTVKQLIEKLSKLEETKTVEIIFDGCANFEAEDVIDSLHPYVYVIGGRMHAPYRPEDFDLINYKNPEDDEE